MSKRGRQTIEIDGVLDIETENWTSYVVGGLLTAHGFEHYHWRREDELVDRLAHFRGSVWAHNGGRFDALWLVDRFRERKIDCKVFCAGQSIVRLVAGDMELRDSYRLVPIPLVRFAAFGDYPKGTTGLQCECGEDCGGYCAIRRDMVGEKYRRLVEYLEDDCRATWSALEGVAEYAGRYDLDLCTTVGASAYATASRRLALDRARWSLDDDRRESSAYRQVRSGYFGGRTQVFSPRASAGHRYDINSAYPAALATLELPVGEVQDGTGSKARRAYSSGYAGIFSAVVRVPRSFLPPLPVRGKSRISYPTGQIAGAWCANELAYAEGCGCRIEGIDEGIWWSAREVVFADFCRYVWDLRDQARAQAAEWQVRAQSIQQRTSPPFRYWSVVAEWLKWYANSLTGKLAQRPEVESVELRAEDDAETFCPADFVCRGVHPPRRCCEHECVGTCGEWNELARGIFTRRGYRIAECAHIQHAAYLTAHTRIALHQQLSADDCGGRSSVYCDTDSVISSVPRTKDVGTELGQFKPEGEFLEFTALAPKTYSYIDAQTGEFIAKSKGIPDTRRHWGDLLSGAEITVARGIQPFRSAARGQGSLFARKRFARRVRADGVWFGDRRLMEDGLTWPVDAKELRP